MPRLRSLLQDLPIPGQRPSRLPALTPYARQSFKSGKPTAKQELAIKVALKDVIDREDDLGSKEIQKLIDILTAQKAALDD